MELAVNAVGTFAFMIESVVIYTRHDPPLFHFHNILNQDHYFFLPIGVENVHELADRLRAEHNVNVTIKDERNDHGAGRAQTATPEMATPAI